MHGFQQLLTGAGSGCRVGPGSALAKRCTRVYHHAFLLEEVRMAITQRSGKWTSDEEHCCPSRGRGCPQRELVMF